jgi:hypothetical protein
MSMFSPDDTFLGALTDFDDMVVLFALNNQ